MLERASNVLGREYGRRCPQYLRREGVDALTNNTGAWLLPIPISAADPDEKKFCDVVFNAALMYVQIRFRAARGIVLQVLPSPDQLRKLP